MSEAKLAPRMERQPPIPEQLERVSVEISRTGEVWLEGRRLGAWVRDGHRQRWVGGDVGYEIERLRALVPGLEIQIDFEEDTPPDLIWRVVNQVGLEHLFENDQVPALPQGPRSHGHSA